MSKKTCKFSIEGRAGVKVLFHPDGSCRPASVEEIALFDRVRALERGLGAILRAWTWRGTAPNASFDWPQSIQPPLRSAAPLMAPNKRFTEVNDGEREDTPAETLDRRTRMERIRKLVSGQRIERGETVIIGSSWIHSVTGDRWRVIAADGGAKVFSVELALERGYHQQKTTEHHAVVVNLDHLREHFVEVKSSDRVCAEAELKTLRAELAHAVGAIERVREQAEEVLASRRGGQHVGPVNTLSVGAAKMLLQLVGPKSPAFVFDSQVEGQGALEPVIRIQHEVEPLSPDDSRREVTEELTGGEIVLRSHITRGAGGVDCYSFGADRRGGGFDVCGGFEKVEDAMRALAEAIRVDAERAAPRPGGEGAAQ